MMFVSNGIFPHNGKTLDIHTGKTARRLMHRTVGVIYAINIEYIFFYLIVYIKITVQLIIVITYVQNHYKSVCSSVRKNILFIVKKTYPLNFIRPAQYLRVKQACHSNFTFFFG